MAREISRQTFLRGAAGALAAGTVFGSVRAAAEPMTSGWDTLSTAIGNPVLLPDNGQFAAAKQVFNTTFNGATPAAIVTPTSVADVQKAMAFAASHGLKVAPRSEGIPTSALPRPTAPWCSTCVSCPAESHTTRQAGGSRRHLRPVCGICTKRWPRQAEVSRRVSARRSALPGMPLAAASGLSRGMPACSPTR